MKKTKLVLTGIVVSVFFALFLSGCFSLNKFKYDGAGVITNSMFYHTWNRISPADGGIDYAVTFSANAIDVRDSSGWSLRVSPITWDEVDNTSLKNMNDYPSGYKIEGVVSNITGSNSGWTVGEAFGAGTTYFMHTDTNSIIWVDDNSGSVTELTRSSP